jgi:hypothetical protein
MASKSRKRRKQRQRARAEDAGPRPEAEGWNADRARADSDERPPNPWGRFPLIELTVLAGIILIVVGFISMASGSRVGSALLLAGLALGSIGGLETSIREHFSGYRSHTLVLAGVPALALLAMLFVLAPASLPAWTRILAAAVVFGAAAWLLSGIFSRRSGGHRFKLSPLPGRRRR